MNNGPKNEGRKLRDTLPLIHLLIKALIFHARITSIFRELILRNYCSLAGLVNCNEKLTIKKSMLN